MKKQKIDFTIKFDKKVLYFDYKINNYSHFSLPCPIKIDKKTIRVFYGKRNKFLKTNIFSFDFDIQELKIINYNLNPLITVGPVGSFYQDGIYPSSIIKKNKSYLLFFIGYERHYKNIFRTSIGLAESNDLKKFKIKNYPLLDRSELDPYFVTSPFISNEKTNNLIYTSATKMFIQKPHYMCGIKLTNFNNKKIQASKNFLLYKNNIITRFTYIKIKNKILGSYSIDNGRGYYSKLSIFNNKFEFLKNLSIKKIKNINFSYPYIFKLSEKEILFFCNKGIDDKKGIMIFRGYVN